MDRPVTNYYAVVSGRYEVRREQHGDVLLEVYHHPRHTWNVDRMLHAARVSLDLYSEAWGRYPHRQLRILEFPRYQTFAQSFPNTVPYSESMGFIANVQEDDLDYPFLVTAHEIAHQWGGHLAVAADVQGGAVISETLAEYGSILVLEHAYGADAVHDYLEHEHDRYLRGRRSESRKELPLMRAENQQYIHYNKGALAMYLLKEELGEEPVNEALRAFLEEVSYAGPPYPTTRDLVRHLRTHTPEDRQQLITDLFETITLFDNRTTEATASDNGDGTWDVRLSLHVAKKRADEGGTESALPVDDHVEVAVFDADEQVLYLERHHVTGDTELVVTVDGRPYRAGVDPHHKLIDRIRDDNVIRID